MKNKKTLTHFFAVAMVLGGLTVGCSSKNDVASEETLTTSQTTTSPAPETTTVAQSETNLGASSSGRAH